MAKFLDNTGLTYLWGKIKTALANKMDTSNPVGTGSLSMNRKANTTVGLNSTAEGTNATASNENAHAEGYYTVASGSEDHAEGVYTTASGGASHAEGSNTVASGLWSHAEGFNTKAAGEAQHVSGKYNEIDNHNTYAEIIGNGTGENNRKNARTLDWSGNEIIAGDFWFNGGNTGLTAQLSAKQDTLTAGTNISILNNTISATDTKPTGFVTDSTPSAISVSSSNDWKCLSTTPFLQVGAGELWMFEVALEIQSNATGYRGIGVSNSTTSSPSVIWKQQVPAVSGAVTNLVLPSFAKPTNGASYYIWVRQNSGSTLSVTYRYRAVRLS